MSHNQSSRRPEQAQSKAGVVSKRVEGSRLDPQKALHMPWRQILPPKKAQRARLGEIATCHFCPEKTAFTNYSQVPSVPFAEAKFPLPKRGCFAARGSSEKQRATKGGLANFRQFLLQEQTARIPMK